jgi:hypothetical protein
VELFFTVFSDGRLVLLTRVLLLLRLSVLQEQKAAEDISRLQGLPGVMQNGERKVTLFSLLRLSICLSLPAFYSFISSACYPPRWSCLSRNALLSFFSRLLSLFFVCLLVHILASQLLSCTGYRISMQKATA